MDESPATPLPPSELLSIGGRIGRLSPSEVTGDLTRVRKVRHGDHNDEANTRNDWSSRNHPKGPGEGFDWYDDWNLMFGPSNEELRQDPDVQNRLQKLGSLSRKDFPALPSIYGDPTSHRIPLFESENGDEYQIALRVWSLLPVIWCPSNPASRSWYPSLVYGLQTMAPESATSEAVPLPKYVTPLGGLEVRTASRCEEDFDPADEDDEWKISTEMTDYNVMIDVESEDMPLWLFVNQQALQDRARPIAYPESIPTLPIFRSLLLDEGNGYYDCARILPSIHCLDPRNQRTNAFGEACESVLKTRSIREPALLIQAKDALEQFVMGNLPSNQEDANTAADTTADTATDTTANMAEDSK